jgi:hypothetical protein
MDKFWFLDTRWVGIAPAFYKKKCPFSTKKKFACFNKEALDRSIYVV